jgi:iron complex outermembrane recepter protein
MQHCCIYSLKITRGLVSEASLIARYFYIFMYFMLGTFGRLFGPATVTLSLVITLLNTSIIRAEETNNPIELQGVTVTSTPFQERGELEMTQPVTVLQGEDLRRKRSTSLGDTLSNELGVSSTSFGPAASRPIIRGLDGPRIKVMENGIDSLDLSSVSPDHGVSIESLNASQIEILRGPATLLYGGNAMGGVVNVVSERIPDRIFKSVNGNIEVRGNTATVERSGAVNLRGSLNNSISWNIGGFKRKTEDYDIPGRANENDPESKKGVVSNSATDSESVSLGTSYIGERGFLGGSFTRFLSEYEIPTPESPTIDLKQSRFDLAGELDNPFIGFEKLKIRAGYNDYQHNEIENSGEIGTSFKNQALESRAELLHAPLENWQGVFGVQFQHQDFSALGNEVLVPDTISHSTGFFLLEERNWDKLRLELGGRAEFAQQDPKENIRSRTFNLFSASVGATWLFLDNYSLNLSATQGQRAPTAGELYSDGAHPATGTFDIGDNALNRETSHNIDFSLSKLSGTTLWKINFFYNHFKNYIFQESADTNGDGVADRVDEDGILTSDGDFLVQNFAQMDATFYGIEAEANFTLIPNNLDLRLFTDYVRGKLDKNGNIPRMTPLRFGLEFNYQAGPWTANLRTTHVMRQNDVAKLETTTSGYTLLNTEVSYRIKQIKLNGARIFLQGNNLLDEEIRVHTSFLKNFAPLPGRAIVAGFRSDF